MVVNSIEFWIFFAVVVIPYYTILRKSGKDQNIWLLIASYFFYGWVDWKMVPLLFLATTIFYGLGRAVSKYNHQNEKLASRLTTLSVVLGVGLLVYFKYLDFFIDQFVVLFNLFGLHANKVTLNLIMPIGISFFTFKLISYVIEVHRENMEPCKSFVNFALYIAFFPTILSGPIDRPAKFLAQLDSSRQSKSGDWAEGMKMILWGLFLKLCIADQLSPYTDSVLNNYYHHNATSIILACILYSFQLYADFCGYSRMAIGVGRVLGLVVTENFQRPFFSKNIAEFWRRWHISLTTWITDYVFMPLNIAFRNWGAWGIYTATILNLVIIGAWHGANWTYLFFGLLHGIMLAIVTANDKRRKKFEKKYSLKGNSFYKYFRIGMTFILVTISFLLFRSPSVGYFFKVLARLGSGFGMFFISWALTACFPIAVLLFKEYKDENKMNIHFLHSNSLWVQVVSAAGLIVYIIYMGSLNGAGFIYFQF